MVNGAKNPHEVQNQQSAGTRDPNTILALNSYLMRREILAKVLDDKKDIDSECGYPAEIEIPQYKKMYDREGVGTRVTKVLPEESWSDSPEVYETEEAEKTEFEKAFEALQKERNVFHYLQRVDVLSGIGRFGILLLGINDGKQLNEAVEGIDPKTGNKTGTKQYKLLYLMTYDESVVTVKTVETDVRSPRYGLPTTYSVVIQDYGGTGEMQTKEVHWTRIIHIADSREMSETYGTPRMKPVWNRLLDIRKILGGSGEMFWKGGFPGYSFETQPDSGDSQIDLEATKKQVEEYTNGLQRYMATNGMTIKALNPQVVDPTAHIDSQLRVIGLTLGIPYRILIGSEKAELASLQDTKTWNKRIKNRREKYVTPMIIRPFVDRMIIFGVLPEVAEYQVHWPDLDTPSDKEKAEVSLTKTDAAAHYVQGSVDQLIPPKEFFMTFLGMSSDEADAIITAAGIYNTDINPPKEPVAPVAPVEPGSPVPPKGGSSQSTKA